MGFREPDDGRIPRRQLRRAPAPRHRPHDRAGHVRRRRPHRPGVRDRPRRFSQRLPHGQHELGRLPDDGGRISADTAERPGRRVRREAQQRLHREDVFDIPRGNDRRRRGSRDRRRRDRQRVRHGLHGLHRLSDHTWCVPDRVRRRCIRRVRREAESRRLRSCLRNISRRRRLGRRSRNRD